MSRARHAAQRNPDRRKFRPEIEGLRAVAALLVAIYHIWLDRVSGGVDVFFLIAGFLITTSLLGQVERSGGLDVARYLGRLAKRLLPASLTVLVAVIAATRAWMPVTRESGTYSEVIASALYIENWALAAKSVDYLERDGASSPVQHFWAMSIQGQFYVIWLAVFALGLWFGKGRIRASLLVIMGLLFAASFGFSVYLTELNQPLAYFHTATRIWEFAAGGLLALALTRMRRWSGVAGVLATWLGLVMIVVTGVLLPVGDAFPGFVALWPITGAALLLIGSGSRSPWGADAILSSRPLVYLGGVSYGLYLWHWPILTFYLLNTGRESATLLAGIVIVTISIGLAILTTRLIEKPIRSGRLFETVVARVAPGRRWVAPLAVAGVMVAVAGSAAGVGAYVDRTADRIDVAVDGQHPGAAVMVSDRPDIAEYEVDPLPSLTNASDDRAPVYFDGCHQRLTESELVMCDYGVSESDVTLMLVGGSHSAHWLPALELIAQTHDWRLISATKSACLFSSDPPGSGEERSSCMAWNEALLDAVVEESPDLVIMTATRGQGPDEHVPEGYTDMWRALEEHEIQVAALRDTPRFESNRVDCLAQHGLSSTSCDEPREKYLAQEDPTKVVADDLTNVSFIDMTPYFCDEETCYSVIGNVVVYYDAHHITATYARTVAPMLEAELRSLIE